MQHNARYHTIRNASLISAVTNTLLALIKIIVGALGHSKVLIADGIHSLSDTIADGIVFIGAKLGAKKADQDHQYGHHRIETLACIFIAFFLFYIGKELIHWAIISLHQHHTLRPPSTSIFVVAILSALVNYGLYGYFKHLNQSINSPLLQSNAMHNKADAHSAWIVIISATGAILGWRFLDPIGAMIIALLIIKNGYQIIKDNVNELIDSAVDAATYQHITEIINQTEGVIAAHQIRTRLHSGKILVDCHILVTSTITVSEGHFIGDQVHSALFKHIPHISDVTVHIDPEDDDNHIISATHLPLRSALEEQLNQYKPTYVPTLQSKQIRIDYLDNSLHITLILPLDLLKTHSKETIEDDLLEIKKSLNYVSQLTILYQP